MIELTVKRGLALAAERASTRTALRCGSRTLTHAELSALANRIAQALLSLGTASRDRVAVVLPNCPEYVAVAIACARAGLVMVTHNYRFTAEEYLFQLQDCGAAALIYAEEYAEQVLPAAQRLPSLKRICLGKAAPGDVGAFEALVAAACDTDPGMTVREEDLFYLGYTSGTTGRAKGAMITHRNRSLAYHYWAMEFGLSDRDVGLHCGPFHHTAPFTFTLTQLYLGGEVVILDHFDPVSALQAIAAHGVTWSFMVPFMLERVLALGPGEIGKYELGTLRTLISGASSLSTRTKEAVLRVFQHAGLHEFYGATEAGVITNLRPVDQARKIRCVGRPVFDTEVCILDGGGKPVPPGGIGDIWMRGPTIFSGYYNAPEKTREVFRDDWCTLGDVGRIDEEGYLYIIDRTKDVIKSGGVNVYPVEIEEVLLAQASVQEVAVIGVPDEVWGEAVHAVIVPAVQGEFDPVPALAACRERLAGYKVPKSVEVRRELPRNANGKVLKRTLREQFVLQRRGVAAEE